MVHLSSEVMHAPTFTELCSINAESLKHSPSNTNSLYQTPTIFMCFHELVTQTAEMNTENNYVRKLEAKKASKLKNISTCSGSQSLSFSFQVLTHTPLWTLIKKEKAQEVLQKNAVL